MIGDRARALVDVRPARAGASGAAAARGAEPVRAWLGARWPAPVAVLACLAVLAAYLVFHHGVGVVVGVRALGALYVLGFVPGHLMQRYVLRLEHGSRFVECASSFLLGSLLTPFLWYALCCVGVSVVFWPVMIGLSLFVSVRVLIDWRVRSEVGEAPGSMDLRDAAAVGLAVCLAMLWSYTISFVAFQGDRVAIKPHYDHGFHAVQVAELARGTPPVAAPFFAGVSGMAYHMMPHVWCDLLRRAAGTDPHTAYFYLALPLRYVLLALACYAALGLRFGRWAALAGVVCMLAFVEPARFNFPKGWLIYLNYNYPTAFGLTVVFLILYYAGLGEGRQRRLALLTCAVLSGLLLFYKSLLALAVMPAVAVVCVVTLGKRREFRWLVLCLGVQAAIAGVFHVQGLSADLRPTLLVAPFAFVEWWWQRLVLPGPMKEALSVGSSGWPDLVRWPVLLVVCIVQRFHLGLLVLAYLVARRRLRPIHGEARLVDRLIVLTLVSCAIGFAVFPIQQGLVWNVSMHVWALVSALCFALMGPAVVDLGRWVLSKRSVGLAALGAAAFVGGGVYSAYGLRRVALWETSGSSGYVSRPFYDCCRYIAERTPVDSVVLHPHYRETFFVSLLTRRRSVLEYEPNWRHFRDVQPILADLDAFRGTAEPETKHAILERYGVDFVIADLGAAGPALPHRLELVFRSGDVGVFRAGASSGHSVSGESS